MASDTKTAETEIEATAGEAPATDTSAAAAPAPKAKKKQSKNKERTGMYVPTPPVLRDRIAEEATAAGKTPRAYVRDLLAEKWGLVLPPVVSRQKYANDEDKKAALVQRRKSRAEEVKAALAAYRAKQQADAAGTTPTA